MATPLQPADNTVTARYGRDYCSFGLRNNINCVPVDEDESARSNIHGALLVPMLVFPEFPPNGVASSSVLDLGYGTGRWCSDFLDVYEYQDCEVVGVDIIDRDDVHSEQSDSDEDNEEDNNVDAAGFERRVRWNLNALIRTMPRGSRLNREVFHLINSRFLADGINANRWPSLVEECRELLVPGGWLQMVEPVWVFQSGNGRTDLLLRLRAWWDYYADALQRMDKDPRVGGRLSVIMETAKFQRVKWDAQDIPAAGWQDGGKEAGRIHSRLITEMLRTHSLDPFKRVLGMSDDEYERVVQGAIDELAEHGESAKVYIKVHVVYGQRPPRPPVASSSASASC